MVSVRSALVWLLLAAAGLSCGRAASSESPNVVLVVVDTLRADRVGAYGNTRGLTPFIDELAGRGTVFANAYAPSSWTIPSVASLLTSRYPTQHHVTTISSVLSEDEVTLAEKLAGYEYLTGGFSANFLLSPAGGYGQGFQQWSALAPSVGAKVRGDQVRRESLPWVWNAFRPGGARRILLYLQYMEPHSPYEPPREYAARFQLPGTTAAQASEVTIKMNELRLKDISTAEADLLASLYDGEVAALDAELRLMFANLERRGVLANAVVVITADHGERFREHGTMIGHGASLFEPVVRIPLIVLAPGTVGGQVVTDNVSLIDVAPTILELVGLDPEPRFQGRSLVPFLAREATLRSRLAEWFGGSRPADAAPDIVLELEPTGSKMDFRTHKQGLVRERMKLLVNKADETELFDLVKDPAELEPITSDPTARVQLHDALTQHVNGLSTAAPPQRKTQPLDDATREKLRALGYDF